MERIEKTEKPDPLDPVQRARTTALHEARAVITARTPISSSQVDVVDVITVATWILDGVDPFERWGWVEKPTPGDGFADGETGQADIGDDETWPVYAEQGQEKLNDPAMQQILDGPVHTHTEQGWGKPDNPRGTD